MGRKRKLLNPWETGTQAEGEHFGRVGKTLLRHPAFTALSFSARLLYLCMVEACAGKPSFTFSHGDYTACGFVKQTFLRARNELIEGGFIRIQSNGRTTRKPSIYEFVHGWKNS